MRKYQLYIIEDEFAAHYFGRERMFYKLFFDFSEADGAEESILLKQIKYITKQIPVLQVQQALKKQLAKQPNFSMNGGKFKISVNDYSYASMTLHERFIHIEATGSYESEAIFFEVLRKWEDFYLAVDLKNNRFGWLKPLKERKFVLENIKQILYKDVSFSTL